MRMRDYAGQRFNMLTAIRFDHSASKNAYYWEFQCDCGKITVTNIYDVRRNKIQSCGCIKRKLSDEELGFRRTFQTYRDQARTRNLEWSIPEKQARLLFKSPCAYCNSAPTNHRQRVYKDRTLNFTYSGIDRKDNTVGYTSDNCVPCCSVCNKMKLDHTEEFFIEHIKKILEVHNGTHPLALQ
jgi:hypothetical protein